MADVGCRNTVFGAEAQQASAHLEGWLAAGIRHFRLEFAHESAAQVAAVSKAFAGRAQRESRFRRTGAQTHRILARRRHRRQPVRAGELSRAAGAAIESKHCAEASGYWHEVSKKGSETRARKV
jgi:hypothetical protein